MWNIESSSATYITITDPGTVDHFYVSGENTENLNQTAASIMDAMNTGKKQKDLKMNMRLAGDLMVLQNRVRVGTTGPIKKAAGFQYLEGENTGRQLLLDKLVKLCS